jgi:transposase
MADRHAAPSRRVDERIEVPLPDHCPHCGGGVESESCETQYQEEIVRRTVVRRFDIAVGRCRDCQRRVQGRHRLQTSNAVGVGNVQLGPEALTLAAILNKQMSLGHTQQALCYGFGLEVSRGGLYRALARLAGRAAPTYAGLVDTARQAPVNGVDETGWKVSGQLQWLHVAVSAQVTVYAILPGRGYEQSVKILGAKYDGFLIHHGWAPYYRFPFAFHQSCLAHLLKRCREMAQVASPAAWAFPRAVEQLLRTGLGLRERYAAGEISERGRRIVTGKLEAKLDRMLETPRRNAANRRLARHLEHEQLWLFTFLHCFGVEATNNTAERANLIAFEPSPILVDVLRYHCKVNRLPQIIIVPKAVSDSDGEAPFFLLNGGFSFRNSLTIEREDLPFVRPCDKLRITVPTVTLAASPKQAAGLILKEGLLLTVDGLPMGLAICGIAGRAFAHLLFGVTPTDATTWLTVIALLTAVSLGACWLPARRDAKVDPMLALRQD